MSTIALDLNAARALNQVTFCPRLYYLQYVDSVMPINEHVEGGKFTQRRVNDTAKVPLLDISGQICGQKSTSTSG